MFDKSDTGVTPAAAAALQALAPARTRLPHFTPDAAAATSYLAEGDTVAKLFWDAVARRADKVARRQKDFGIWRALTWNQLGEVVDITVHPIGAIGRPLTIAMAA